MLKASLILNSMFRAKGIHSNFAGKGGIFWNFPWGSAKTKKRPKWALKTLIVLIQGVSTTIAPSPSTVGVLSCVLILPFSVQPWWLGT